MNCGQSLNTNINGDKNSVSSALINGILKSALTLGIEIEDVLDKLSIDEVQLKDPVGRVPYGELVALLSELFHLSDSRRDIGIELGRRQMPGSYSALGYAAVSCETLGDAIRTVSLYERVTLTPGKTTLTVDGKSAFLSWTTTCQPYSYLLEELILSSWFALAHTLTGQQTVPDQISLTGPAPSDNEPFIRMFGQNILFDQPCAYIQFDVRLIDFPIAHSDPFMNRLMREQAARIQQTLEAQASFAGAVKECIDHCMATGDVSQTAISGQLCIGVRTLRRRLNDEGTSFKAILDDARCKKARDYLSNKQLSVFEVAMLLGYKDHSTFSAAFKRWFGQSPQAYRENIEVK